MLKVTASIVTARTENDRIVYLYRDDVVPSGLTKDSLEHLKGLGFIVEEKESDSEAPKRSRSASEK